MKRDLPKKPEPADEPNAGSAHSAVPDPLTPAQREFARLLGRLLAEEWAEQHAKRDGPKGDASAASTDRDL